ncbi:hypothetical protein [Plantactinospora sp. B5E13]|uniref:hypothetical protein n=1 Tax=unclassified Plantactinospora TaxID=2631981 RepID=UPI00325E2C2A
MQVARRVSGALAMSLVTGAMYTVASAVPAAADVSASPRQGGGVGPAAVEMTFTVSTGGPATNIRSCAQLSCGVVTTISNGTFVTVDCQRRGETVTGNLGTSAVWDRIVAFNGPIGFASDTNIRTGYDGFHPGLPRC